MTTPEDLHIDLEAIAARLRFFAGRKVALDDAKSIDDFGCLATLPQVQAKVPRPIDGSINVEGFREAIEKSLLEAAESLQKRNTIRDGRVKKIPVTPKQLRDAITLAFNLEHDVALTDSRERRNAAKKALKLKCSERGYRDDPGPEFDLLRILSKQLSILASDHEGTQTERIELSIIVTAGPYGWDHHRDLWITHIQTKRTVRPIFSEGPGLLVDQLDIDGLTLQNGADYKQISGKCRVGTLGSKSGERLLVRFPTPCHGEDRDFCYAVTLSDPLELRFNTLMIRPLEAYDHLIVRAEIRNAEPKAVASFTERRERPGYALDEGMTRVEPEIDERTYRLEVHKPSPNLFLGFLFTFVTHQYLEPKNP
ncbi:hypothetical protein OHQ89_16245 [Streptomyces canus]|uniref:hypothetical protein n=1 Tax=Streptomyces canus TaxID=58343 RepID=UPI0030E3CA91